MDTARAQVEVCSDLYFYFVKALRDGLHGVHDISDDAIVYAAGILTQTNEIKSLFYIDGKKHEGRFLPALATLYSQAATAASQTERINKVRDIGNRAFAILTIFPEALQRPRTPVGPQYYEDMGRRSYSYLADKDAYNLGGLFAEMAKNFHKISYLVQRTVRKASPTPAPDFFWIDPDNNNTPSPDDDHEGPAIFMPDSRVLQ